MTALQQVLVPDIGDFEDVEIIEILVEPGQSIDVEEPLLTLESDKASMEVPSPISGKVVEVLVKVGERISEGSPIVTVEAGDAAAKVAPPSVAGHQESDAAPPPAAPVENAPAPQTAPDFSDVHAGPSVRRLARELEIDLNAVKGTGEKGRITKEDVKAFLAGPATPAAASAPASGAGIPDLPVVDFSKFGPVEDAPMSRIQKLSAAHLHKVWLNVPAVTHADESDITETDQYRRELDKAAKEQGYRVTLLSFLIKASVSALRKFPTFNSSINPAKDGLILKHYYNIGVAVDTPDGLVVPVIKDCDKKGVDDISRELGETSKRARDGKLTSADMQGGTFTISSLGGIGGAHFSPIVNAPEVAILGVLRSKTQPVWNGESFAPRNILPLAVSYDHRAIDGALAARFTRHLCHVLEDVRRLVL